MSSDNGSKQPVGLQVGGGVSIVDGEAVPLVRISMGDLDIQLAPVDAIAFGVDVVLAAQKSRSLAAGLVALDAIADAGGETVDDALRSVFLDAMVSSMEGRAVVESPDATARGLTVVRNEIERP